MNYSNLSSNNHRKIAAIFCIIYILIQIFQQYVININPQPSNITEEIIQNSLPLNRWRSFLILISFFLMIYTYTVITFYELKRNILLYFLAFLGFFIFCFLEINIRSVELFYFQMKFPSEFLEAKTEITKTHLIENYTLFQSIQYALYFPLLLSQAISSLIISFLFSSKVKINYALKIGFGINALRLFFRLITMYLNLNIIEQYNSILYLPLVIIIFGLLSYWLFNVKDNKYISATK